MISKSKIQLFLFTSFSLLFFDSCKREDDTTDPVILLEGDNPYNVDSIGGGYREPGYTAVDDNDGDLTSKVIVETPSIGFDSAKSYKVIYKVQDYSGNPFSTYRIVNIRNSVYFLEGVYNHDTIQCGTDTARIYQSTVTTSPVINGNFAINNFANKGQQAILNGKLDFTGNLTFETPANLLDSDSTVVLNIQSGNLNINPPTRLELLFYIKDNKLPDSTLCRLIMAR